MTRRQIPIAFAALGLVALACVCNIGAPAAGGKATVGDYVWLDANGDGIQQDEEDGVPGVAVELHTADRASRVASTTTDSAGLYSFTGVEPGDYRLFFDPPEDFEFTQKDKGGDDALDSDAYPDGPDRGWTDPFEVGADDDLTRDAGLLPGVAFVETPTPTPLGRIGEDFPTVTPMPEQKVQVRITVYLDEAGHVTFVDIPEDAELTILREGAEITIVVEGANVSVTCIELTGQVGPDGAFVAEGAGVVAGFQNIHGTFEGMITYDDSGLTDLSGQLTLGDDGKLPQGKEIVYTVEST